jgi:hypothetical protein
MHPVGSVEEELEVGAAGRRVRRNRRRVAGGLDRDLELLGGRLRMALVSPTFLARCVCSMSPTCASLSTPSASRCSSGATTALPRRCRSLPLQASALA